MSVCVHVHTRTRTRTGTLPHVDPNMLMGVLEGVRLAFGGAMLTKAVLLEKRDENDTFIPRSYIGGMYVWMTAASMKLKQEGEVYCMPFCIKVDPSMCGFTMLGARDKQYYLRGWRNCMACGALERFVELTPGQAPPRQAAHIAGCAAAPRAVVPAATRKAEQKPGRQEAARAMLKKLRQVRPRVQGPGRARGHGHVRGHGRVRG